MCPLNQYEFSLRPENVLPMKMGSFKRSCLINCDKILNFANFEKLGYQYSEGRSACYVKNLDNFLTAASE